MAVRFNFPPVATSAAHAANSGVTHYTPTLDIDETNGCCTAYGQEPHRVLGLVWTAERARKLTPLEKMELVERITGISPVKLPDPDLKPLTLCADPCTKDQLFIGVCTCYENGAHPLNAE